MQFILPMQLFIFIYSYLHNVFTQSIKTHLNVMEQKWLKEWLKDFWKELRIKSKYPNYQFQCYSPQ